VTVAGEAGLDVQAAFGTGVRGDPYGRMGPPPVRGRACAGIYPAWRAARPAPTHALTAP